MWQVLCDVVCLAARSKVGLLISQARPGQPLPEPDSRHGAGAGAGVNGRTLSPAPRHSLASQLDH